MSDKESKTLTLYRTLSFSSYEEIVDFLGELAPLHHANSASGRLASFGAPAQCQRQIKRPGLSICSHHRGMRIIDHRRQQCVPA